MILWLLLWHFNDCNEKRTQYPAANRVLCHNIIYSKHVVWWFLLNKMDTKDLFGQIFFFGILIFKNYFFFLN